MQNFHKKFELSPRLKLGVGRGYSQNKILKVSAILCLVLAMGLAIHAVQLIYNSKDGAAVGAVLGAADTTAGSEKNDEILFEDYAVKTGDTLFNISQKFNINWTTVATLNNLKAPFTLKTGQIIKIPKQ